VLVSQDGTDHPNLLGCIAEPRDALRRAPCEGSVNDVLGRGVQMKIRVLTFGELAPDEIE
jgi:hypothetical protein